MPHLAGKWNWILEWNMSTCTVEILYGSTIGQIGKEEEEVVLKNTRFTIINKSPFSALSTIASDSMLTSRQHTWIDVGVFWKPTPRHSRRTPVAGAAGAAGHMGGLRETSSVFVRMQKHKGLFHSPLLCVHNRPPMWQQKVFSHKTKMTLRRGPQIQPPLVARSGRKTHFWPRLAGWSVANFLISNKQNPTLCHWRLTRLWSPAFLLHWMPSLAFEWDFPWLRDLLFLLKSEVDGKRRLTLMPMHTDQSRASPL